MRWLYFPTSSIPSNGTFIYCQLADSAISGMRPTPQPADGTLLYCQLQTSLLTDWRPSTQPANGTLLYCSQDINQFNRTP